MNGSSLSLDPVDSQAFVERGVDIPGFVACAVVLAGATAVAGLPGGLVGVLVTLLWLVLGTPVAVAGGHVFLPALFVGLPSPTELLAIEAGFVLLVLAPTARTPRPGRFVVATVGTLVVMGTATWLALAAWPLWATIVALLAILGGLAYLAHRASLVRLDLVSWEMPADE